MSELVLDFRQRYGGQEGSESKTYHVFIWTNCSEQIHV